MARPQIGWRRLSASTGYCPHPSNPAPLPCILQIISKWSIQENLLAPELTLHSIRQTSKTTFDCLNVSVVLFNLTERNRLGCDNLHKLYPTRPPDQTASPTTRQTQIYQVRTALERARRVGFLGGSHASFSENNPNFTCDHWVASSFGGSVTGQ